MKGVVIMKKIIAILLVICMLAIACSCGDKPAETTAENAEVTTTVETKESNEPVVSKATIMSAKNGCGGILTLVHDDGDLDTVKFMNDHFEQSGLKASIALIATRVVTTSGVKNNSAIASYQRYLDTGRFQLCCHTYTHKFWGLTDKAESGYYQDYSGNKLAYNFKDGNITFETKGAQEILRECFPGQRVLTFCRAGFAAGIYKEDGTYLKGSTYANSDVAEQILKDTFIACRGGGSAYQPYSSIDLNRVTSYQINVKHKVEDWLYQARLAANTGGWMVYMIHKIQNDNVVSPTSGTNTDKTKATQLFDALAEMVDNGDLWVAFFEDAALYVSERKVTEGTVTTTKDKIEVELTNSLDERYDYPLTVRVEIPADWENVNVSTEEEVTPFEYRGKTYVYVNIVPNTGIVELTCAD